METPLKNERQRSNRQNKALHLYCAHLSEALNTAGISQRVFLRGLEVENSPDSVKAVFRALGKAKYLKGSTKDLTTKECSDLYDEINKQSSKIGVFVPWPSEEELSFKYLK